MKTIKFPLIAIFILSLSIISCEDDNCISGEGSIETRTIDLASFDKVSLFGVDRLTVKQGDVQEIKVTGYPNIIDELNTSISNQEWEIKLNDGCYNNADMDIQVIIPNLKAANLTGSGSITIEDFQDQENQLFALSGSGDISIGGNSGTEELLVNLTGSGNVSIEKDFTDMEAVVVNISGSGDYDAFPLKSSAYDVIISGSGNANIHADDDLRGTITGSGNINYKGNPEINVAITGSGSVNNSN